MPNLIGGGRVAYSRRFGFACAAVVVVLLIRHVLLRFLGLELPPFITFYLTVLIVTMVAGLWPGLLATVLASFFTHYWILREHGHLANAGGSDAFAQAIFFATGVFVSVLAEGYRKYIQQNEMRYRFMLRAWPRAWRTARSCWTTKDGSGLRISRSEPRIQCNEWPEECGGQAAQPDGSEHEPGQPRAAGNIRTSGRTGQSERFEIYREPLGKWFRFWRIARRRSTLWRRAGNHRAQANRGADCASGQLPELNPNFIFETDLEGNISYINPALARTFPAIKEVGTEHPLMKDWSVIIASLKANKGIQSCVKLRRWPDSVANG